MQCRARLSAGRRFHARPASRLDLGGYHDQLDGSFYVGVQVHSHVELANLTDSAVRQTYFALGNRHAGSSQSVSDVVSTDRAEQFAFITSHSSDGHFQLSQLGSASFSRCFLLGSSLFQLGTTLFERSDVRSGRGSGLALRQQVVAAVAGLDVYLVAQVAQVGDFFPAE